MKFLRRKLKKIILLGQKLLIKIFNNGKKKNKKLPQKLSQKQKNLLSQKLQQ